MKKILLSLLFCFTAASAFALTAEEVHEKILQSDITSQLPAIGSYRIEYTITNSGDPDLVWKASETVSKNKRRIDSRITTPKSDIAMSVIVTEDSTYVSNVVKINGESFDFDGYQVLRDTSNVQQLQTNVTYYNVDKERFSIVFDDTKAKKQNEYVLKVFSQDREQLITDYRASLKNGKQTKASKEKNKQLSGMLQTMFYWVDKKTFLVNKIEAEYDIDASERAYNDSYDPDNPDKSREASLDFILGIMNFTAYYSDYKKIAKTEYYFPYLANVNLFEKSVFYNTITMDVKVDNFQVLEEKDIDESLFVPANVKKGNGKIPSSFRHPYKVSAKNMMKEIGKSMFGIGTEN